MTKPWGEIKKQFMSGVVLFSFFIVFTFIMSPEYKQSELSTMTFTVSNKPIFKQKHFKGSSYWAELYFEGKINKYEIRGIDYKYLKDKQLKDSIKRGDQVTISTKGDKILLFSKNGFEYMDFVKAQFHKSKNRLFARGVFLTGLIFCIIPLFFKDRPTFNFNGQIIEVKFGWIFIISMTIAFIILSKYIGFRYVSGDEFII
jgi:hypothetical protein